MQAANFSSAFLNVALRSRPPPPKRPPNPPPHFFRAASNCARVTPFGSCCPPRKPPPNGTAPPAGGLPVLPGTLWGRVMPSFFRHSRSAVKRPARGAAALLDAVDERSE